MTTLGPSPLMTGDNHLRVEEARAAILAPLTPVAEVQTLPLAEALGRVLAADLICPMDVPPHDNSAMDGYAFDGAALQGGVAGRALELAVVGTAYAGAAHPGVIAPGRALRIMTGAVMPAGLDTVVPQEMVTSQGQGADWRVRIPADAVRRGENRRRAGEDLAC